MSTSKDLTFVGVLLGLGELIRLSLIAVSKLGAFFFRNAFLVCIPILWIICRLVATVSRLLIRLLSLISDINAEVSGASSQSGNLGSATISTTSSYRFLDVANAFLPIDTLLVCIQVIFGIWATCLIYKFVKSWCPAMAT